MEKANKEAVQKNIMLSYYNRYLRDHGTITQRDYLRLAHLINAKYPIPAQEK